MLSKTLDEIFDCILEGDAEGTAAAVQKALDDNLEPEYILEESMIAAMTEVGRQFEDNECFVPEMLVSARAMKQGLTILRPHLAKAEIEPIGSFVIGTTKGDLHDIGKNLVSMMLEGAGFKVVDLGTNISAEEFVGAVQEHQPQIVGISALLTTTMSGVKKVIDALVAAELRERVTVMVGGAPVTQQFADDIGADLFAPDAASAASQARALMLGS